MNQETPKYALDFASHIEGKQFERTDAIIDVPGGGSKGPALFIKSILCPDYETACLAAERLINEAIWSYGISLGRGTAVSVTEFSRFPEFLVSEKADGKIVESYLNALAIKRSPADFERVKSTAAEAAASYRAALEKGTWETVQWGLTHEGRRPTYRVASLERDKDDPIYALLRRKGIL